MYSELLDNIMDRVQPVVTELEIEGRKYVSGSIKPVLEPTASRIDITTLTGMVNYLNDNVDKLDHSALLIHVESPTVVKVYSSIIGDFKQRECFLMASPILPNLRFDSWIPADEFNIHLQAAFINDPDTHKSQMLSIIGNIREEGIKDTADDGVTQVVTVRQGIARLGEETLPNPVLLRPYRTFVEVEQPMSEFVFRMESGPVCRLIEADGNAWRNKAMLDIASFLKEKLPELAVIS
ncbi:MAG: hypothetical protein ACNI27_08585 [Desulfovibrio sp.]